MCVFMCVCVGGVCVCMCVCVGGGALTNSTMSARLMQIWNAAPRNEVYIHV